MTNHGRIAIILKVNWIIVETLFERLLMMLTYEYRSTHANQDLPVVLGMKRVTVKIVPKLLDFEQK